MSLVTRALPVVLLHDFVEVASCVFAALFLQFVQKRGELLLDFSSFLLELDRAIPQA